MKNKYALLAGAGLIVFVAGIISLLCVLYEKKEVHWSIWVQS